MDVARVEHFGALHLHRGRLWLGKPRGVRTDIPLGRWMGLCLGPAGIRCYEGSYLARRRTPWEEITSIAVRFDGLGVMGYNTVPGSWLPSGSQPEDPQRVVSLTWLCGNAWNRNAMLVDSAWDGEVTEQKTHAVLRLPDALRRRPALRQSLRSEDCIAALLSRLAVAPDVDTVDAILGG